MPTDFQYNMVAENPHSTVVAKYPPEGIAEVREKRAEFYQSEAQLEKAFIKQLESQAYDYLPITDEDSLKANLRTGLETLNTFTFSDRACLIRKFQITH